MNTASSIYSRTFIEGLIRENALLKIENDAIKKKNEELQKEQIKLQLQLQKFAQMVFGKKGERFVTNTSQLMLDMPQEATVAPACNIGQATKITYTKENKPGKRELFELGAYMKDLPHVCETKEPDHIPAGAIKIGEDRHETLEYTRGKAFVKVVIIPKYKVPSPACEDKTLIIAAATPERPLFKCLAGASLLALILVDKYCDHLPLARQAKRFERSGFTLPYNTIVDLNAKSIDLITVLYEVLRKLILESSYIHADETSLKVLFSPEGKKHKEVHGGFLWCYHNSIDNMVFFDYQHGRGEECTQGILKDFKGYLQTDGWKVYKSVATKNKDIIQICCWAHARRKFMEALPYARDEADYALKLIGELYAIERQCKEQGLKYEQIAERRQQQAVPVLQQLHGWMIKVYTSNLPSSPISTAIGYTLNRWNELCVYVDDGRLNIDNNPVERSIRPVAVGRKNYLFAGSPKGAQRLAVIYSLIGTCIMNKVDPYEWLKDIIGRINSHPMSRLQELLPHNWKKSNMETISAEEVAE